MQKLKTKKGASKRLKLTKRKKLRRYRQGKRHLLGSKPSKRKRRLRRPAVVKGKVAKLTKKLLPYG